MRRATSTRPRSAGGTPRSPTGTRPRITRVEATSKAGSATITFGQSITPVTRPSVIRIFWGWKSPWQMTRRRVICHGDFHPQNILMTDGRVTGVIDWPNVIVADPAFDVASTRVILGLVPVGLLGVPPALRGLVEVARRILVARYLSLYRRRQPLDAARLAYYEALACMRGLVRTAEARLAPIGESGLNPLDASGFGEQLAARFARITGVMPRLPAVPQLRRR